MQVVNDQYFIGKTIVYDLVADAGAILIEKKSVELVSVEECCFHKYTSATGPAGVLLDVSKINIKRSSFVQMVSKLKENIFSAASAKLLSANTTFTLSSASKCEIGTNNNFYLSGEKINISFINNTHNPINHITFTYIHHCEESDTSFCMICHNPSGAGVEFQSQNCDSAQIHNCVFAHNTCTSSKKDREGIT